MNIKYTCCPKGNSGQHQGPDPSHRWQTIFLEQYTPRQVNHQTSMVFVVVDSAFEIIFWLILSIFLLFFLFLLEFSTPHTVFEINLAQLSKFVKVLLRFQILPKLLPINLKFWFIIYFQP